MRSFFFFELLDYRLSVTTTTRRLGAPAWPICTGKGFEANGCGKVSGRGSGHKKVERIPGAGAPNLERVLTGGPGVGGEDGGELEWHANIQPAGGPLVPNRIRTEGRGKRSQKWPCAGLQKGGTRRSHVGWYGWLGVKDRRTGWQPAFPMMCHKGKWWCHLPEGGSSWSSPHRKRDAW